MQGIGEDGFGDGGHQRGLRCGQSLARIHIRARHGAGETVGGVEQLEHGRHHERAHHAADNQRHFLTPRGGFNQVAGFQVLQVVVGNGSHGHYGRATEQSERHQEIASAFIGKHVVGTANSQ